MKNKNEAVIRENMAIDDIVYMLATYFETQGMVKKVTNESISNRFSEFKMRLLKGSYDIEWLTNNVFEKFGLYKKIEKETPEFKNNFSKKLSLVKKNLE